MKISADSTLDQRCAYYFYCHSDGHISLLSPLQPVFKYSQVA